MYKPNKKGFTMIELIGAMIIIAVLTVAGIVAVTAAINNSRLTATQEDLAGFKTVLETFTMESPQLAKGEGSGTLLAALNELDTNYLEGEMKVDRTAGSFTAPAATAKEWYGLVTRKDPWGTQYNIHISIVDANLGVPKTTAKDSVIRVLITSNGKNTTGVTTPMSMDGVDDLGVFVQYINGSVGTAYLGTKEGTIDGYTHADDAALIKTALLIDGKWTK